MLASIPPEILQFGVAGLLFIVWVWTFKMNTKVSEDNNKSIRALAEQTTTAYQTAISDSQATNKQLLTQLRDSHNEDLELKTHLIRVLTRMEEKLNQPMRCPYNVQDRRASDDGTN
ncbi:MAG TPA: hypothetical protein VJ904_01585 [Tichowtungia sp.]|nr:hypothetical protein [Tichowtungia sp.]